MITPEVLLAEHEGEVEFRCGGGLFRAVVAVDVVMERLERAFADAAAVQLDADSFAVSRRPSGGLLDIFQIAVVFARKIEFVEDIRQGFEADGSMSTQIDGGGYFYGWKSPLEKRRDERGRRRDDVRKQSAVIHLLHDVFYKICQLRADGLLAVAVAVEERVELKAVLASP